MHFSFATLGHGNMKIYTRKLDPHLAIRVHLVGHLVQGVLSHLGGLGNPSGLLFQAHL